MITDEDVVQLFRNLLATPVAFKESEIAGRTPQIFRGAPGHLWKGAPGCIRHLAVFDKFGVIPKYCFDCYKVLIAPRTIMEFFKVLMILEKIALPLDNTRKFMVEGRDDSAGTYKCFIYCVGIEEGSEVLKDVQKVVAEEISPLVGVTLKRGCSEFAHAYPKYANLKPGEEIMQYKKDWQIQEESFDKNFVINIEAPDPMADSPDAHTEGQAYTPWEIYCLQYWLSYAATIGDTSYLAITGTAVPPIPNLKRPPFGTTATPKEKR